MILEKEAPIKATRDMPDKKGRAIDFNYKGQLVKNASVNGHLSVATPGLVKGLLDLHKKYGTMDLASLLEPSIKIAEKGFPVYKSLAKTLARRKDTLWLFEANRKVFFKNNTPLKEGDILTQKDLAKTIKLIFKKGSDVFYKGNSEAIVTEMKKGHGLLRMQDFESAELEFVSQ